MYQHLFAPLPFLLCPIRDAIDQGGKERIPTECRSKICHVVHRAVVLWVGWEYIHLSDLSFWLFDNPLNINYKAFGNADVIRVSETKATIYLLQLLRGIPGLHRRIFWYRNTGKRAKRCGEINWRLFHFFAKLCRFLLHARFATSPY